MRNFWRAHRRPRKLVVYLEKRSIVIFYMLGRTPTYNNQQITIPEENPSGLTTAPQLTESPMLVGEWRRGIICIFLQGCMHYFDHKQIVFVSGWFFFFSWFICALLTTKIPHSHLRFSSSFCHWSMGGITSSILVVSNYSVLFHNSV